MKSLNWLSVFLVAFIAAATIAAQDSPYTLQVDVSMVFVDVAVFDDAGVPIMNLGEKDFEIYEDGRRERMASFASSTSPYNVLLIIDQSGSMARQFPFLIQAVNRFLTNLRSQDRIALATFDGSVHKLVDWRSVRAGSRQTIHLGRGGDTDFYGALNWASKEVGRVRGRKTVLIFTDGEDRRIYDSMVDAKAFRQALETVRKTNVSFHFVGLGADPERGGEHIKRIADETGGQAYFPDKIEEVVPLYDRISREFGISYTLGYLSDKPARDGTYRNIRVNVPGEQYRVSQSRSGYFAN